MIPLSIQIKSIIFSFIYGILFFFLTELNHKYLYNSKGIIKAIINTIYVLDNVLLYFLILKYINNGVLHYYFIISIIIGFLCSSKILGKFFGKR